jgi:hypothetical protein
MNIMIEDAESRKFFTGEGQWAENAEAGKRYAATRAAYKAAKQELVGKFNIVGYIPSTKQFVNLDHGQGKSAGVPILAAGSPPVEPLISRPAPGGKSSVMV